MTIGMVGLGRMGGNMARRLAKALVKVVAWNRTFEVAEVLAQEVGVQPVHTFEELVAALPVPRVIWLMLPAGQVTDEAIARLKGLLTPGDVVVDGANGNYKDAIRHGIELKQHGVYFIDCGVSGGIWGLTNGYCLMFGGEGEAVERIIPYVRILAPTPETGWLHCGPVGAGHFTKMVHNGIEYGMMQAMAEGFALLQAKTEFGLDIAAIAELWRHGSVVRSWLLDLTAEALAQDRELSAIEPYVADSGEGRWTALEAVEQGVPAPVISLALMMRFASQGKGEFASKLLAMMRKGFGGHEVKTGKKP